MSEKRYPDDRVDNERFSSSPVLWVLLVNAIVLILVVLSIVYSGIH